MVGSSEGRSGAPAEPAARPRFWRTAHRVPVCASDGPLAGPPGFFGGGPGDHRPSVVLSVPIYMDDRGTFSGVAGALHRCNGGESSGPSVGSRGRRRRISSRTMAADDQRDAPDLQAAGFPARERRSAGSLHGNDVHARCEDTWRHCPLVTFPPGSERMGGKGQAVESQADCGLTRARGRAATRGDPNPLDLLAVERNEELRFGAHGPAKRGSPGVRLGRSPSPTQ